MLDRPSVDGHGERFVVQLGSDGRILTIYQNDAKEISWSNPAGTG
jgi:hypothetical protein